jgi:uncharacterized repeat protein (TIGR01451 family)
MKKLLAFVAVVLGFMLYVSQVSADYGCNGQYGQYGGCNPSYSILINKLVGVPAGSTVTDPTAPNYVDNLSPSDPRFKSGQLIFFKLVVKNTSNTGLTNVTVKDFVPSYIEPVSGPGTYDGNSRTITFNAGDFAAGEEKVYYFKMQVDSVQYLPADKGLFCIVNKAQAYNNQASSEDSAQLCIEKQVAGVTTVPSAGPELGLLLLGLNLGGLGAGIFLKRKSI